MSASWSSIQYNFLEVKHIEKQNILSKKTIFFSSDKVYKDLIANKAR